MATSNSYDYAATGTDIITEALEMVGALPEGGSPNASQTTGALRKLNMMIKAAIADDLQVWVAQRATLFGVLNRNTYKLGAASGHDIACKGTIEGTDYFKTTLTAAAAAAATALTVDSITGFADTYALGIVLDSGDIQWTTVSGAPSGSTITAASGLTGAASSGNNVYAFPAANTIQRPVRVLDVWRHTDDGVDIPLRLVSRAEYDEIPYKSYDALPVEAFYNPLIDSGPEGSNGELQIWPELDDVTTLIQFRYLRPLQDMDSAANDVDFPQEWYEALTVGLAYRLSWNYGLNIQDKYLLRKDADVAWQRALDWSIEHTSIFLEPDYTSDGGFR